MQDENIMPLALAIGGRGMKTEDALTSTVTGHIKNVGILSEHNIKKFSTGSGNSKPDEVVNQL